MIDDLPGDDYSKARIPAGWAHQVGRDTVADALMEAGAVLGSLGLWGPRLPPDPGPASALRVVWMGDALPGYHGAIAGGHHRLHMSLYAVPSDLRSQIGHALLDGPLQAACRWSTAALTQGNVLSAGQHQCAATHTDGGVHLAET